MTIDVRNIPGTNCYLDEASIDAVKELVSGVSLSDIHFIGSGNYHYLSYFFLGRVNSPFYLVLFDNHPDCQAPAFGDILSCGGWVRKAVLDYPLLRKVFIVGASPEHIKEEEPLPEKIVIVPEAKDLTRILDMKEICAPVNIYISLDKDVLSKDYAITDWDQGEMDIYELCDTLRSIVCLAKKSEDGEDIGRVENKLQYKIIGVDICGDSKSEPNGSDHPVNHNSNICILEALSGLFPAL